jgi:aryl-alcohol dehydrogenase-like predicted oxidoreductase
MLRATSADRLALGSAQFGAVYGIANSVGQVPIFEIEKMIRYAREAGLDTIDTAISYGDSEDRLGDVGVSGWKVVTKLPAMPESAIAATWVSSQVKGSMKRLNVSCLYGVLLHHPGDLLGVQGSAIFEALEALQREGLVEKIGISAYGPDEVEAVTTRFPINIVQAPLNIIDRRVQESEINFFTRPVANEQVRSSISV